MKLQSTEARFTFRRRDLLRWMYLGRLTLVTGILAAAFRAWGQAEPTQTLAATVLFLSALVLTTGSFFHTHVRGNEPGDNFVYLQVLFDILVVTTVVHITQGGESPFAFLYILVISAGALLLPLPGGVLAGALATLLFLADIVFLNLDTFRGEVLVQMALFATVAVITGWLGDRVRKAGLALGEVESELRQLRLDTGDILASIGTGVLTVDGAGRLAYLNPAGASLLGIDVGQWMGSEVVQALNEAAPGLGGILSRSLESKVPVARSKAVARRNGVEATLGVSTTILDRGEGRPPSITAIFQDITDQERIEALNRRNERLEAVAELSASLAHEIKNPLSSIRSAVEQITRGKLDGEDRQLLERLVVTESDRLSRLLSEFLEYSGLRMGRTREVDLVALTADCLALVRRNAEVEESVRFVQEGMSEPVRITGDVDLLHRAVFNLILNAAQFAGPGGIVRVEVLGHGDCPPPPGGRIPEPVCLRVSDSGPGIAAEDLPRIFDPFYTTRPGGSGLGLALVHRAVEAHQGAVLVSRGRDGGAEFTVYLPGVSAPQPKGVR